MREETVSIDGFTGTTNNNAMITVIRTGSFIAKAFNV